MQTYKFPDSEKVFLDMLNQIFQIEIKLDKIQETNSISRNLTSLKNLFETQLYEKNQSGLTIHNPIGESYAPTRLDCEANIAGESAENLTIIEVIKPIIRFKQGGLNQIVQKAVVVVQNETTVSKNIISIQPTKTSFEPIEKQQNSNSIPKNKIELQKAIKKLVFDSGVSCSNNDVEKFITKLNKK